MSEHPPYLDVEVSKRLVNGLWPRYTPFISRWNNPLTNHWVFPKIGGKPPKWMVKLMEKPMPMTKWMIWVVFTQHFRKHPIDPYIQGAHRIFAESGRGVRPSVREHNVLGLEGPGSKTNGIKTTRFKWNITYTTWKVDGATAMYWFIMAPYSATFWELRHLLSLRCIFFIGKTTYFW